MKSDLSAARRHLERAFYYLCGDDQFSRRARKSVNALMDGILSVGGDDVRDANPRAYLSSAGRKPEATDRIKTRLPAAYRLPVP